MAERLIKAADNVLAEIHDKFKFGVSKETADELEAASEDMKRIIKEIKEQQGD